MTIAKQNTNRTLDADYQFNNAATVVRNIEENTQHFAGSVMVQGDAQGTVSTTDANIQNNSCFITELWN